MHAVTFSPLHSRDAAEVTHRKKNRRIILNFPQDVSLSLKDYSAKLKDIICKFRPSCSPIRLPHGRCNGPVDISPSLDDILTVLCIGSKGNPDAVFSISMNPNLGIAQNTTTEMSR